VANDAGGGLPAPVVEHLADHQTRIYVVEGEAIVDDEAGHGRPEPNDASLDTVTEHHISQVISGQLADRTRIVVAHRASTAASADMVIWLEEGRLRAVATHHELWRDPEYRTMFAPEPGPSGPGPTSEVAGAVS